MMAPCRSPDLPIGYGALPSSPTEHTRHRMRGRGQPWRHRSTLPTCANWRRSRPFSPCRAWACALKKRSAPLDESEAIFAWLKDLRLQPFPGTIDRPAADRGAALYARHCASCHGSYREQGGRPVLAAFPNWIGDVGTDPLAGKAVRRAARGGGRAIVLPRPISVEAGPRLCRAAASGRVEHRALSAQWIGADAGGPASTRSDARSGSWSEGHSLDFESGGIRFAADGRYPAASRPYVGTGLVRHAQAGRVPISGHRYGETLTPDERRALIEFLKRL